MVDDITAQNTPEVDEVQNESEEVKRLTILQQELEKNKAFLQDTEDELVTLREHAAESQKESTNPGNSNLRVAELENRRAQFLAKQNEIEKEIKSLQHTADKEKIFDKNRVFKNIRRAIARSKIKLGQLERDAGYQPGYMSRLEKPGNTTEPTMEFVVAAAKALGVSLDLLVNGTIGDISPTEEYIMKFLTHLVECIRSDTMIWELETVHFLRLIEAGEVGAARHPLFAYEYANGSFSHENIYYNSRFFPLEGVSIAGDCYHAHMKNTNAQIYIMKCARGNSDDTLDAEPFYEMYFVEQSQNPELYNVSPVLCTLKTCGSVATAVDNLYKDIEEAADHVHINDNAKRIIDSFMDLSEFPF